VWRAVTGNTRGCRKTTAPHDCWLLLPSFETFEEPRRRCGVGLCCSNESVWPRTDLVWPDRDRRPASFVPGMNGVEVFGASRRGVREAFSYAVGDVQDGTNGVGEGGSGVGADPACIPGIG